MSRRALIIASTTFAAALMAALLSPFAVKDLRSSASSGGPPSASALSSPSPDWDKDPDLVSYAEPGEDLIDAMARSELGRDARQVDIEMAGERILEQWSAERYHGPSPEANSRLMLAERKALAAGSSPKAMGMAVSGTMRLLVVAVEFAGTDAVVDFVHPKSLTDRECITETRSFTGPLHGQIKPPGERDNNTLWRPSFDKDYYESIIFGHDGLTERVRMDLTDPDDGQPGIDMSGQTMQAFYTEASGGLVTLEPGPGGTLAWVQVPHSEAYYGASRCTGVNAPDVAAMQGLPTNPSYGFGPRQLVVDIVDAINAEHP
ncbi:MAG: hypothetical protein ACK2T6_01785, partial [Anaerolineae bacterium]